VRLLEQDGDESGVYYYYHDFNEPNVDSVHFKYLYGNPLVCGNKKLRCISCKLVLE